MCVGVTTSGVIWVVRQLTSQIIASFLDIFPQFTYSQGLCTSDLADDYRYFIDLGDGTISDDLTAQHVYAKPGDYKLTLVAVDSASNFYKYSGKANGRQRM